MTTSPRQGLDLQPINIQTTIFSEELEAPGVNSNTLNSLKENEKKPQFCMHQMVEGGGYIVTVFLHPELL